MIFVDTTLNIPRGSVEYVTGTLSTNNDLTGATVQVRLTRDGTGAWLAGTFNVTTKAFSTAAPVTFDAVTYPDLTYTVQVRLTDTPEVPIIDVGRITIT